jgi:hypothetical protein
MTGTVVHGWCGFVEKSNEVVSQQMVLNKLWIPDVLIDIIKDYLYISAAEVLRKFYRFNVNRSITDLITMTSYLSDVYGRQRIAHWSTGHIYGGGDVQFQGLMCVTCGDFSDRHDNLNGCCVLVLDEVDELLNLSDDGVVTELDAAIDWVPETIPEVTWGIDIPVSRFIYADAQQAQFVLDALQQAREDDDRERIENELLGGREPERYDYDMESEMADYAEYEQELRMEEYRRER